MIRVLQKRDIDRVAEIWLECNRKAHDFIPAGYWRQNFDMVKAYIFLFACSFIHTLGQDYKTFPQIKTNRTRILLIDFQL